MKIATFNVNGISARMPNLLRWLKESQPDVACLQELKAPQERFPIDEIKNAGYNAYWKGQKSWNGVAILSKYQIEQHRDELPGDPEDIQSRFIEASVNGITVICTYQPNGNPVPGPKFDYKLSWTKRLQEFSKKLIKENIPVVITGDYNIIPEEMDVYKPERVKDDALFQPESRQAYQDFIGQGWTDAIRHLFPEERIYTYWDYFRNAFKRNAGMRIDHFLLNEAALSKLRNGGVDKFAREWERPSDHAPVWIELRD